jgi:hypothetical protein
MVDIHVLPFHTVAVSTKPADSDAHLTCILADSHGPDISYDLASQLSPDDNLLLRSVYDVPVGSEPLVSIWARCVSQLPRDQQPHATGDVSTVSVSIRECSGKAELEQSRLIEHLVARRHGSELMVEFANEECNIDVSGEALATYATSYELAAHAASLVAQRWSAEAMNPAVAAGVGWRGESDGDGDASGRE